MNIPFKYQKSFEIPNETIMKYKTIIKHYISSRKKCPESEFTFEKIIKWLFSNSLEKRKKICSIENKWATIVLHQLFRHESSKKNLRFVIKINEQNIPFVPHLDKKPNPFKQLMDKDVNHFLNYFAMFSENYEVVPHYDEKEEFKFLREIRFYYPNNICRINDLNKDSIYKEYYPFFTLSNELLSDEKMFKKFFSNISDDKAFNNILEVKSYKNNKNSNNEEFIIDIPEWIKQTEDLKICFSISEIFLAFFEQVISIKYILYNYDNDINNSYIDSGIIDNLYQLKKELFNYLKGKNNIDLFIFLNIEDIINQVFYSPFIEKFVEEKKYKLNDNFNNETPFWEDNLNLDNLINEIKRKFYNISSIDKFIDCIMFLRLNQVFTNEDFFLRRIFENLKYNYEKEIADDLYEELISEINEPEKPKKKKKKKKKKKEEEKNKENNKDNYIFIKEKNNQNKEEKTFIQDKKSEFMGQEMFIHLNSEKNIIINHTESKNIISQILISIINNSMYISEENNKKNAKIAKKKEKQFFLFSTTKNKSNQNNQIKIPFIQQLDIDLLSDINKTQNILSTYEPLKEYIINKIKYQINDALKNENYKYTLDLYGSYKSYLNIESSDIDLYFLTSYQSTNEIIQKLFQYFSNLNIYEKVNPIPTANVPILKLSINYEIFIQEKEDLKKIIEKFKKSNEYISYQYNYSELNLLKIDISFPVMTKKQNKKQIPNKQIEFIKHYLNEYIEIKSIIRIIKRILTELNMNNPYKGGLSSYPLFLLCIAFMKNFNSNIEKYKSNRYGHIFHDLIKFYSSFNFLGSIIDLDSNKIYKKRDKRNINETNPIIYDPITQLNSGKSCFRITEIKNIFEVIYSVMENIRNDYEKNNYKTNENLMRKIISEVLKNFVK